MRKYIIGLFILLLSLAGCGSDKTLSTDNSSSSSSSSTGVASIQLMTSSTQLPSDDSNPVTISALALNANNQAIPDVAMIISTNSGYLNNQDAVTQDNGIATAELHVGSDRSNRTITITASSGTATATLLITVSGTKLSIQGPAAVTNGTTQNYTISLLDAGGEGIANQVVTVASTIGNTLSSTSLVTNASGNATVNLTGTVGGVDTLTASALGLVAAQSVSISGDSFAFSSPTPAQEINIGANVSVTITWQSGGAAQVGQIINFASTRGTLSAATATTNGAGTASVSISSATAGPAVINATTPTGVSAQINVLFVATTPNSMSLQASPNSIGPAEQSTLTAVVLDANGNLVKNQTVQFNLSDNTQGSLDKATAVTDSEGRAQAVYTASNTTSGSNKITVTATVQGTAVTTSTTLTVGGRAVFISLGTGNKIVRLPDDDKPVQYDVPYVVQVTDANGKGVAGTTLTMSVLTDTYGTGSMAFLGGWTPATQVGVDVNGDPIYQSGYTDVCPDEDTILGASNPGYRNGSLDTGEDLYQADGTLQAGNIATVIPKTVTTDSNGFAYIDVIYPMEYAYWVYVHLTASTTVAGTESSRTVNFTLPGAADDYNTENSAPPGYVSPFGVQDWSCP